MMAIDKRYERISRSLSTLELAGDEGAGDLLDELVARPGAQEIREDGRFAGFYSREGLLRVLEAYGVSARLEELDLVPWQIHLSRDGGGRHRLQVTLQGEPSEERRLIDLVVELRRVREATVADRPAGDAVFDVVVVEWLALQNPRARFTPERPRLPGQSHPGLGLGYTVHNMILLMARRIGRAGVLNVPRHLHLAVIYDRCGYRFLCERQETEVRAVADALTPRIGLAAASWAVERGFVEIARDDAGFSPWSWDPVEMLAPVDESLEQRLEQRGGWLRRLVGSRPKVRVSLDVEGFAASLDADPVEGLDPGQLRRA